MSGRIIDSFPQTQQLPVRAIRLGLRAHIFSGGTPDKANLDYWLNGELPWIGSGEVNQRHITVPTAFITGEAVRGSATKLFPAKSVAMALAGQGKTKAMVATMGIDAYGNQSLACISKYKGDSRFLFWWLTSLYREIRGLSSQDTRDGLNQAMVGQIPVPDFEPDTQKAIADFLDRETARIDQLIEKKQWFVRLTHEKLNAVIHSNVNEASSSRAQPLHRFCKIVTGKTPSRADESNFDLDEGLPWATPANLGVFEPILTTKEKLTEDGVKGQIVAPPDTVLINGIGASIGKVGFTGREMTFNQQIHGIIQIRKLLIDRFLFFVMHSKKDEIVSLASNTTIPIINADRFGRISVPLPSDHFQAEAVRKFEASVKHTRSLTGAVSQSIELLREFRAALITAAVTGQIDVTTWGKEGQTDRRLDRIEEAMRA